MDPAKSIINGFDIHVYYKPDQLYKALDIYTAFLSYLKSVKITPTYHKFYREPDPPHLLPLFTVHIMGKNPVRDIKQNHRHDWNEISMIQIAYCISWLSINRDGLDILIHPNTAKPFGDVLNEIVDHTKNGIWMVDYSNNMNKFSIDFFKDLLTHDAKYGENKAKDRLLSSKL